MKNIQGLNQDTYRTLIRDNLSSRLKLSHFYRFNQTAIDKIAAPKILIESPCDEGVARNGGRRGARYAPAAIRAVLGRMHLSNSTSSAVDVVETANFYDYCNTMSAAKDPFDGIQDHNSAIIQNILKGEATKSIVHLGGGHDHIFPLLQGVSATLKSDKLIVINVDAHTDTRIDPLNHSGTPFRQFASSTSKPFELIQIGIKPFANPPDNWKFNYPKGVQHFLDYTSFVELRQKLDLIKTENATVILSLDADFLSASVMEAVSAVAYDGGEAAAVLKLIEWYKSLNQPIKYFGIYEYNPVFDNLSQRGARLLAHLIYQFWA